MELCMHEMDRDDRETCRCWPAWSVRRDSRTRDVGMPPPLLPETELTASVSTHRGAGAGQGVRSGMGLHRRRRPSQIDFCRVTSLVARPRPDARVPDCLHVSLPSVIGAECRGMHGNSVGRAVSYSVQPGRPRGQLRPELLVGRQMLLPLLHLVVYIG